MNRKSSSNNRKKKSTRSRKNPTPSPKAKSKKKSEHRDNQRQPAKNPPTSKNKTVDLIDLESTSGADGSILEIIKLSNDEKTVIPFAREAAPVSVHYCDMDEIRNYIHCNTDFENGCVLCQIGRTATKLYLLPVYVPTDRQVALLRIGSSLQPRSLRPQIMEALKASLSDQKRQVLFIKKLDNFTFSVRWGPLPCDVDDGAALVEQFDQQLSEGIIDLTSAIPRLSNETLTQVEAIAAELRLRGIGAE